MFMKMTEDGELLARYARQSSEEAFAALVDRHLNLVYSAALRQVRSPQLAEEVSQSVFADLARNAGKLKPDTILTAWLYQVARRTAIDAVRRESRRQARERIAAEMAAMNTATDWIPIEPLLDEAMETLEEGDRAVILLRYFDNKSLREVGEVLGTSDDAAQKRVSRAVDRLREFFGRRGVAVGATGLGAIISANAVQAAPTGLAAAITGAALGGTAITAATITTTIVMTTLQKTLIAAAIAVVAGGGIYEAHKASQFRDEAQTLRQQQADLSAQVREMQRQRDEATNRLALLASESARKQSNDLELLKLRGEVGKLHNDASDPTQATAKQWLARVAQLKAHLQQTPGAGIPELSLLKDSDWLDAVKNTPLDSDTQYRRAMSYLRSMAQGEFASLLSTALQKYVAENGNQFPTDLSQLKPYFASPPDDAMLQRWEIVPAKTVPGIGVGDQVITEVSAVDDLLDSRNAIGSNGSGAMQFLDSEVRETLNPVRAAYAKANNGNWAGFDNSMLMPYAQTPEQQAAVQKMIDQSALEKK
jgi:RNA polymerase sigma factor (sigma-70 family)